MTIEVLPIFKSSKGAAFNFCITRSSADRQVKNGPSTNGAAADFFGNAINEGQKPSRVIVRDCNMINAKDVLEKTELPYTEGKTEVVIDRITSAAMPRQIERVPGGAEFDLNLVVNMNL